MKKIGYVVTFIIIAFFVNACTMMQGPAEQKVDTGSIITRVQWPDNVPDDLVNVRMSVSADDMKTVYKDFRFKRKKEEIYGIHGVAAGDNRTVIIEGSDSNGQILFESSLSDTFVEKGQINDCGLIVMEPVGGKRLSEVKVTAEAGDGKVTLKWRSVAGADNYNIYMNGSPGASKKSFDARKATSSTSYEWKSLSNGNTYYFIVTAENRDGESAESNEVSSTPQKSKAIAKVPSGPANVRAEPGNGMVTITWDSVSGKDGYNIYMNRSSGASKKNFDARKTATSTSYTWKGLKNRTTYYFVVTTENSYGESGESNEVSSTPGGTVVPPPQVPVASPAPVPAPKPKPVAPAPVAPPKPVARPKAPILSPAELLLKADDIRAPGKNFVMEMTITSKKGKKEKVNKTITRIREAVKSLVVYTYPPTQKGQVILMVESNMWVYFPGTKRAIRISPTQQLLGQVSNADVARVVYSIDYNAESVEEDTIKNEKYLKMLLKAKSKGAAYGSINLWLKKNDFKLYKAEFFTLTGRLLKTIYYKGYRKILGKERPMVQEIHDAIKTSEMSIIEYTDMRVEETPERYFQKTYMPRVGR
jgi:hypothetical protein